MTLTLIENTNTPVLLQRPIVSSGSAEPSYNWDALKALTTWTVVYWESAQTQQVMLNNAIAQAERLLAKLQGEIQDMLLLSAALELSEDALLEVWDNPEDAVYDEL